MTVDLFSASLPLSKKKKKLTSCLKQIKTIITANRLASSHSHMVKFKQINFTTFVSMETACEIPPVIELM